MLIGCDQEKVDEKAIIVIMLKYFRIRSASGRFNKIKDIC